MAAEAESGSVSIYKICRQAAMLYQAVIMTIDKVGPISHLLLEPEA